MSDSIEDKDKDTDTRTRLFALIQDLIGEKAEKYHSLEGRLCLECPMIVELFKDIRNAYIQDKEKMVDEERDRYGFVDEN